MSEPTPASESRSTERTSIGDRPVRPLPVIAVTVMMLSVAGIVLAGRFSGPSHPARPAMVRHGDEPVAVHDVDHYVPGSPPAVAERFLRAWMRARYEDARDLSTGEMRGRCEHAIAEVGGFNAEQMEEYRRTRVYVDATNYDLEHIEMHDLASGPDGNPRREVRGQAHAYAAFNRTTVDSRRGQTFVMVQENGAWRVADRTWETFDRH
jgi:hypothetical protein